MNYIPLLVLHAFQVLLSLNAAWHSLQAILALRQVEGTAKKAAKISAAAAEQLHKTRTTETAGALAILLSLSVSVYVLVATHREDVGYVTLGLNGVCVPVLMKARSHMVNFWQRQRTIPVVAGSYNRGLQRSEAVTERLSWLEITFIASVLLTAVYVRPRYPGRGSWVGS